MRVMEGKNLSGFLGRAGEGFLGGTCVRQLEQDFQAYFKVQHAVSFNSATTALQAAVAAAGIGPGDEVITSPFTMPATATAILLNNAIPVFADIDPHTYCLSARTIESRLTSKTKAILVVNIFGSSADYGPILDLAKKRNLVVIEDNAQSPGATYQGKFSGTLGDIGVFSFNVHKVIQSGEGGMLVTNDRRFAYRAQLVRNHGEAVMDDVWNSEPEARELLAGSNYRFSELHAAIVIEQFKKLEAFNAARAVLADYFTEKLSAFSWLAPVSVLPGERHVYYLYPVKYFAERLGISRKTFAQAMKAEGFLIQEGYQKPLYLLPIYQQRRMFERSQFPFISSEYPTDASYEKGLCPVAERLYESELIVTHLCQPPKTKETIDQFIETLSRIESSVEALCAHEQALA